MLLPMISLACGSSLGKGRDAPNLIVNGDAELGPGSTDGSPVPNPGWTSTGEATSLAYGETTGPVPFATRSVSVVLLLRRNQGSANDGFADDLSL